MIEFLVAQYIFESGFIREYEVLSSRQNWETSGEGEWLLYSCFGAQIRGTCVEEIPILIEKNQSPFLLERYTKILAD